MSTWTAPATWANSAVTAAQMNTEIRDHDNFLKGALDKLTNSTTADTSDTMYLGVFRAAGANPAIQAAVTADTVFRIAIRASGEVVWSSGSGAADTNLYRNGADELRTDGKFVISGTSASANQLQITDTTAGAGINIGTDSNLYRAAANVLASDDQLRVTDGIATKVVAGAVIDGSFTATPPSGTIAIDVTNSKIFVRVGATWKSVTVA